MLRQQHEEFRQLFQQQQQQQQQQQHFAQPHQAQTAEGLYAINTGHTDQAGPNHGPTVGAASREDLQGDFQALKESLQRVKLLP